MCHNLSNLRHHVSQVLRSFKASQSTINLQSIELTVDKSTGVVGTRSAPATAPGWGTGIHHAVHAGQVPHHNEGHGDYAW